jgi:hypothetical protein
VSFLNTSYYVEYFMVLASLGTYDGSLDGQYALYVSNSKIIRTFAITPFKVCHTAFCACMLRVGTTVVTWWKFDLDRVIFLAAVTV